MKLVSPHERVRRAIEADFPKNSIPREKFDKLCVSGCQDVELRYLLLKVAHEANGRPDPLTGRPTPKLSVYDLMSGPRRDRSGRLTECTGKVSRAELVKLPGAVERVAEQIAKVQSLFARLYRTKTPELNDQFLQQKQQKWSSEESLYAILPVLLRTVATDLENEFNWIDERFGAKRYDSLRDATLRLLRYVEDHTGKPHYEDLIKILDPHLKESVTDGHKKPGFLDEAGKLAQYYSCAKKYGFRPRKRPRSGVR